MSDPYAAPAAPVYAVPPGASSTISDISFPLVQAKGWIKFIGIMSIILGAIECITIIGAVIGWLPIWMGVLLTQSASAVERAYQNNDVTALKESLDRLRTFFIITGVLFIIGLVLTVLEILFFSIFAGTIFSALRPGS
jgi:hypothetical protein